MDDNRNLNQDWDNENQGKQRKKSRKIVLSWSKDKSRNAKEEIKGRKRKRRTKAVIAVVLVVVVAAGGVFTFRRKGKKAQASGNRVMEYKVQKGNLSQTVEGTGTLANADSTDLKIPAGLKIKKIKVSEGDEVKKGDTLATVDKTSLLAALAETQAELDDVNKQLGDEADSDTSKYVESSVDGRVKKIYASKNTEAADTVLEKGALMLISLDGKMAVKMDTSVSLTGGQEVKVVLSSGSSVTGTVTKAEDESCTITVTDNGTKYNDKVTAYTSSGTKIGAGNLYINKEAKVTATSGTVSSVLVSENESVSEGDELIKLKGDFQSEEYLSLESEKEDLEEKLASLLKIAKNNTITADSSGIVTSVNVSEDTESGSASESSSSGSSVNSSGSGSTGGSNTATATGMSAVKTTNTVTATATATTEVSSVKRSTMIKAVSLSTGSDTATQNISERTTNEKNEDGTTEASPKDATTENTGSSGSQTGGSQTGDGTTNNSQNGNSGSTGTDSSQTGNSGTDSSQTGNSSQSSSNSNTSNSSGNNTTSGSGNTTTKSATENKTSEGNSSGSGNGSGTNNQNSSASGNASGASGAMNGSKSSAGGMSGFSGSTAGSTTGNSALSGTTSGSTSTTASSTSTDTNTELTSAFGIASGDEMTISVSIDEMDILSIKTGQKATITFDAIENKEYEGEITNIDKNGTTSNGTTKYPVEITVTKEDSMMSGMNASVTITTSEVSDALLIPAAAVTEEGNTSYVYTQKDSKSGELSGKTEVQTGDTDGTNIVITSGLSEGDTVYYSMSAGDSSDKNSDSANNQDKQNMKMNGNFGGGRGGNAGGNPPSGGGPGGNK